MAFSQSFSLGENTLNQLDICEVKVNSVRKTVNKPQKLSNGRAARSNDFVIQSPDSGQALDVVDESPTEKTNIHGTSIRERLKNASTSKKMSRKYMRRSRSDPITTSDSKVSKSTLFDQVLSENFDAMFDSTMEWTDTDDRSKRKTSIRLDEKFEDGFDQLLVNIQTPAMVNQNGDHNESKGSDLIALSDSDGSDKVNVSDIERLMQTEHNIDKTVDLPSELAANIEPKDQIEWDDSAFFNELLASQQIDAKSEQTEQPDGNEDAMNDVVFDVECVSMQCTRDELEKELDSCFLDVSHQLLSLNATETKSIHNTGTQLDSSLFSRSITTSDRNNCNEIQNRNGVSNSSLAIQTNKLGIDSLTEWNCSAQIIKAYKKKGIQTMFEWQQECLNNPKVIFSSIFVIPPLILYSFIDFLLQIKYDHDNLVYSAPTSAGKTFVSEVLMFQTILKRQKKVIVILPFISVVREKMYSLQVIEMVIYYHCLSVR